MEQKIGRELLLTEEVHHIDADESNNNLDNLKIVDKSTHRKSGVHIGSRKFKCIECGVEFVLFGNRLRNCHYAELKGSRGPFCSRRCAGKANQHSTKVYKSTDRSYIYVRPVI